MLKNNVLTKVCITILSLSTICSAMQQQPHNKNNSLQLLIVGGTALTTVAYIAYNEVRYRRNDHIKKMGESLIVTAHKKATANEQIIDTYEDRISSLENGFESLVGDTADCTIDLVQFKTRTCTDIAFLRLQAKTNTDHVACLEDKLLVLQAQNKNLNVQIPAVASTADTHAEPCILASFAGIDSHTTDIHTTAVSAHSNSNNNSNN